ncbi:hypothetical protein FB446DRAFT_752433 [Lentinula raphanica]|uniref:HIT-type domain-containing protein n=1 Tax=Lentinula raphanica TaxID=153919 RepID=A0AA38PDK6_9AGAR|nr:hypothetical protein FB446DRAFT_752433 [Lentinula raphanica]KAJ3840700.1 hypothetical protein F5878DRAFT_612405 [Lentinula raphanica]
MPPKRTREHLSRQVNDATSLVHAPELLEKRTQIHLDQLEKSNYNESASLAVGEDDDEPAVGKYNGKGRARQTLISDKINVKLAGNSPAATKKKSTMNIRSALLYRKNLATLIEESGIASLPPSAPSYLTAVASPPKYPPRLICSVCGYWGEYKCRKCAMPYCDLNCEGIHIETRCERRVL